jgi:acyl-CoA reductase-like NAD-dependent aldehyde dehydrogenase
MVLALEVAASLLSRRDQLVDILSSIATHRSAEDEIHRSVRALAGATWEIQRYQPKALKQVNVFLPSNNVLYSYVLFGIIPSLFTRKVILRPSARTRNVVEELHAVLTRIMPGKVATRLVLASVSQRVFVELSSSADLVVFNGQHQNGLQLCDALGDRAKVLLFGSGPNPIVAGPDCAPRKVSRSIIASRFYNSGQDCLAPDVIFVHAAKIEAVLGELQIALARIKIGERSDRSAIIRALVYEDVVAPAARFLDCYSEYVEEGGKVDKRANIIEPTVLVFPEHFMLHPPEFFAPIIAIVPYSRLEFVREWANNPSEISRGMYLSSFDEPSLTEAVLGSSVVLQSATALDNENGNSPFGGFGAEASSVSFKGTLEARPLLLSAEASCLHDMVGG